MTDTNQVTPVVRDSDTLPMKVAHMGFLIDRLFEDCSPLQFLRELTKNSIEAILRTPEQKGEVRWDLDTVGFSLSVGRVSKLCIIDSGVGMNGVEMVKYINHLSSSFHTQSKTGNFGVGAKISTMPINPVGLIYQSWVDGVGYMIHLHRSDRGDYGLLRFDNGEYWTKIEESVKPDFIDKHGTKVILLGKGDYEDTMSAPEKAPMPRKWILRYLNSRFYCFPDQVAVKTREGWDLPSNDKHNFLRTVTGMGPWLEENSQLRGKVRLDGTMATAHWWIVKEGIDTDSGHYTRPGHVAALYQDELYELVQLNAGYARLHAFGAIFGCERIVIYVEPDNGSTQNVSANTARTQLLIDNEPLNWAAYAAEFRDKMPEEFAAFQDQIGVLARSSDHKKSIRERLKTCRDLFKFGRYRPSSSGDLRMGEPTDNTGGQPRAGSGSRSGTSSTGGGAGGRAGSVYGLFTEPTGEPADFIPGSSEPDVLWVSSADRSRAEGDMDDRAAKYIPEGNQILANRDFRVFTDMKNRWVARYKDVPGAEATIESVVREWFEQQLVETVMSALALKSNGKWSMEEVAQLWDEAALTAAVLPRYHIDVAIKRVLGQQLGKAESAA